MYRERVKLLGRSFSVSLLIDLLMLIVSAISVFLGGMGLIKSSAVLGLITFGFYNITLGLAFNLYLLMRIDKIIQTKAK